MLDRVDSHVRYWDRALSDSWVSRLRDAILPAFPPNQSYWYALDGSPGNVFEAVISSMQVVLQPGASCIGVEYWARAQPSSSGMHFHFDRDAGRPDQMRTPLTSSILYLSDAGGPTVIFNARAGSRTIPSFVSTIFPKRGRLSAFDGALLHGVYPGRPSRWPRVAMFMNWWSSRPKAARSLDPYIRKHKTDGSPRITESSASIASRTNSSRILDAGTARKLMRSLQSGPLRQV